MISDMIPPDLRQFVEQELASGHYGSTEEMIADGLRLLRQQKPDELRRQVLAGLEQIDRGEGIELEDEEALRSFFDDVKLRGRNRLAVE